MNNRGRLCVSTHASYMCECVRVRVGVCGCVVCVGIM